MKKISFFLSLLVLFSLYSSINTQAAYETVVYADAYTGSTDSQKIQQAINDAAQNGKPKTVVLSDRAYTITSPIIIKKGVKLQFSYGSQFVVDGNFRVLELEQGASLEGAYIAISNPLFDSDVIYLDGKYRYYNTWNRTTVRDVNIVNWAETHKGTGVSLYANQPNGEISFVLFDNIKITGLKKGVSLKADKPISGNAWINANRFTNFSIEDCIEMITINSSSTIPNEVSGNQFTNLQIQPSLYTNSIATISGQSNYVQGMVWDTFLVPHTGPLVTLTNNSVDTIIDMPSLSSTRISNSGYNLKIR